MMTFRKIIKLCESRGFLQSLLQANSKLESFKIGPGGALLQQNLYLEWFNSFIINKDVQVFPAFDDVSQSYEFARQSCLGVLPYGMARMQPRKWMVQEQLAKQEGTHLDFGSFFQNDYILECCIFTSPLKTNEFFFQWQKDRKIWWRKFSPAPGRYILTEIKTEGDNREYVNIIAKYSWGDQLLETISINPNYENLSNEQLTIKDGRKMVRVQCITSRISLSVMLLNTLCDAYDEAVFQDGSRVLFRFHRKLAPYKISFAVAGGCKDKIEDLKSLSLYLCRKLRKNNISCLLTPISHKNTLETQWKLYDEMGIPYNLLANEGTLRTGIAFLRSRDTTLKEQIHVTDLPSYVEKLFKNY